MYEKEDKAYYANLAWPELVLIAEKGGTIYYSVLRGKIRRKNDIDNEKIDIDDDQDVRHALSPIQEYCLNHDVVPHLTSLVVKKPPKNAPKTDKPPEPGTGFKSKLGSPEKDREAVYAFNWKDHPNPGYDVFLEHATASFT